MAYLFHTLRTENRVNRPNLHSGLTGGGRVHDLGVKITIPSARVPEN